MPQFLFSLECFYPKNRPFLSWIVPRLSAVYLDYFRRHRPHPAIPNSFRTYRLSNTTGATTIKFRVWFPIIPEPGKAEQKFQHHLLPCHWGDSFAPSEHITPRHVEQAHQSVYQSRRVVVTLEQTIPPKCFLEGRQRQHRNQRNSPCEPDPFTHPHTPKWHTAPDRPNNHQLNQRKEITNGETEIGFWPNAQHQKDSSPVDSR